MPRKKSTSRKSKSQWPRTTCFVACAFDEISVDTIYDKVLLPALKKHNVNSVRVDRIVHNENVDKKILTSLEKADICVADLTNARPSVYFEAGYAEALSLPVIYLARKDHLAPQPDDVAGNRKVHFDVLMRNIIDWTSPSKTFTNKFEGRLRHVLKPIAKKVCAAEQEIQAKRDFDSLSQNQKLAVIEKCTKSVFRSLRISPIPGSGVQGYQASKWWIKVIPMDSLKKDGIVWLGSRLTGLQGSSLKRKVKQELGRLRHGHLVAASLRSVPSRRIEDALPSFNKIGSSSYVNYLHNPPKYVHILSGIESRQSYESRLREFIKALPK